MPFRNRSEAGRKLAVALAGYKDQQPVVLALPRGGVLVAAEVAGVLEAPLDLILVRKVGVPFQPELAMGAVVDGGAAIVVRNEDVIAHAGIKDAEFTAACASELAEIERRRQLYLGNSERAEIAGRTAIVIDDGVATGATTRAALRATRLRHPLRLVLAVPVAPTDSLAELRAEADDVVCLEHHEMFGALGYYCRERRAAKAIRCRAAEAAHRGAAHRRHELVQCLGGVCGDLLTDEVGLSRARTGQG
jgi:putative phosphoribosyl transferase